MNTADPDTGSSASGPLERIAVLARRGQAAYRQQAAVVRAWLRQHLGASGDGDAQPQTVSWLRQIFAQHHLRERHETFHKAIGPEPATPDYVRNRLEQIERTKGDQRSTRGTQSR